VKINLLLVATGCRLFPILGYPISFCLRSESPTRQNEDVQHVTQRKKIMKNFIKWFAIILIMVLLVFCVDMNFHRKKFSTINDNLLIIINIASAAILLILIVRFFVSASKPK
jgi:hypothetical protein